MPADTGAMRIATVFAHAHAEGRAAVIPYLPLGYPQPERSLALAKAAIDGGADLLELGIPFSDPLADGPLIQQATHVALREGMTVARCLEMAKQLRKQATFPPFVFMGYYNPILAYGVEAFCRGCTDAGVDGLIVPDLPPEEGEELEGACQEQGIALIYLIAPTSPPARVQLIGERSQGFIYLVSVTGITGPRDHLPSDLAAFVERVRAVTDKPLAVGFGISSRSQASEVADLADGVIVGSELLRRAQGEDGAKQVREFVAQLRSATIRGQKGER